MFHSEDRKHQMKNVTFQIRLTSLPQNNIITNTDTNKKSNNEYFLSKSKYQKQEQKEIIIKIQPWTKIIQLKSRVGEEYNISNDNIRLFYKNTEMINSLTALDYQLVDNKDNIIFFKFDEQKLSKFGNIAVYGNFPSDKKIAKVLDQIKIGFIKGLHPSQNRDGTSGTYFMKSGKLKETVAVFKPIDEEAFTPNNPKGYPGKFGQQSFRKGILSGEGGVREVAASILDMNNKKIFKIPETTFVEVNHNKFINNTLNNYMSVVESGSFRKTKGSIIHNFVLENVIPDTTRSSKIKSNLNDLQFVNSEDKQPNNQNFKENLTTSNTLSINTDFSEENCINIQQKINYKNTNTNIDNIKIISKKYGSLQKFVNNTEVSVNFCSDIFPIEEVQKIAILDFRILNCDRNDENILVINKKNKQGKREYKLIPIDHSLSLPDCIEISEYEMCWMGWKQSQEPLSKNLKEYIASMDILGDMKSISEVVKIRPKCLQNYRISNITLQIGVSFGLTLYEIGMLLYRPEFEETPSVIEDLCTKSMQMTKFYLEIRQRLNGNLLDEEIENQLLTEQFEYDELKEMDQYYGYQNLGFKKNGKSFQKSKGSISKQPKKMSFHDNSFFEMKSMSTNINSTNNNTNNNNNSNKFINNNNTIREYENLNYSDKQYKVKQDKQYIKGSGTNDSKINNKNKKKNSLMSDHSNFDCVRSSIYHNNSLGLLMKKNSRTRSEPKVNLGDYWDIQENEDFRRTSLNSDEENSDSYIERIEKETDCLDIKEHKFSIGTMEKQLNLSKKLRGESIYGKNNNVKIQEILESPFNNIYFFEFEKRLKEYLQENYPEKVTINEY